MTTNTPAPAQEAVLTTGQILAMERRSNMTDDEALRFARAIESALLSKLRAPVADERSLPTPALFLGTKLMPYEERMFFSPGMREALKYTSNPRQYYSEEQMRAALASAPVAEPYDSEQRCRAYYDSGLRPFITDGMAYNVWQAVWHAAQFDRAMRPNSSKPGPQSAPVSGETKQPIGFVDPLYLVGRKRGMPWNAKIYAFPTEETTAPLYGAPQASEAVCDAQDATGRTPTAYALEFAEYLARDAEYVMACLNASQRANEALLDLAEEVTPSEAYQAAEEAAEQADEAFTEAITGLQSGVFEFRKRRDRAALSAQPGAQKNGGSDAN